MNEKNNSEAGSFGPYSYGDPRTATVSVIHWPRAPLSKGKGGKAKSSKPSGKGGKKYQGWTY
jgi:hypothetical protein